MLTMPPPLEELPAGWTVPLPSSVVPLMNFTVPLGIGPGEAIVAVKVTLCL